MVDSGRSMSNLDSRLGGPFAQYAPHLRRSGLSYWFKDHMPILDIDLPAAIDQTP